MKRIVYLFVVLFLVCVLTLAFTSCGSSSGGEKITLKVYNWGEYISDGSLGSYDTNAEFEKYYYEKYGVKIEVLYTTYTTNEDMYSKISSGAGTYDIIIPSDYMIEKMKNEGLLWKFDPTELENYENVSDDFKNLYYDPDNCYSVPYTYGMVGIIYNKTMVDEQDVKDQSWDLLFNEKYKGKILQFNNPRDGFATAMYSLGIDVNSTDKADWDKALEKLIGQKDLVQAYVSDEIFNKMISNSASIAAYYAGDYITMRESNPDLAFYYPSYENEGTNLFVDAMCIPKDAQQKEAALEYINFMLSEDASVANALHIGYASPNKLVKENADYAEEMGEEAMDILYGAESVNKNYGYDPYYHSFTPEIQEYVNMLWENLTTENSTELWVHVSSILIVGALIGAYAYTTYVKKKRSKHYRKK